jgi:hypothetical protein
MLNVANVMRLFNLLVTEKYPDCKEDEPSPQDYATVDQLFAVLQLLTTSSEMIEGDITLKTDDYDDDDDDESFTTGSGVDEETHAVGDHSYPYQTMREIVQFANTDQFSSVKRRYRLIRDKKQSRIIKKYVKQQGTKRQKLKQLDCFVLNEFNQARSKCLPIHDRDLRRFAIRKVREMNFLNFVASSFWVLNFKCHHITSQKVTKFVIKNYMNDREKILIIMRRCFSIRPNKRFLELNLPMFSTLIKMLLNMKDLRHVLFQSRVRKQLRVVRHFAKCCHTFTYNHAYLKIGW